MPNIFFDETNLNNISPVRKAHFELADTQAGEYNKSYKSVKPEYHILIDAGLDQKSAEEIAESIFNENENFAKANAAVLALNNIIKAYNSNEFVSNVSGNTSYIKHTYGKKFIEETESVKYSKAEELVIDSNNKYTKNSKKYISYESHSVIIYNDSNNFSVNAPFDCVVTEKKPNGFTVKHKTYPLYLQYSWFVEDKSNVNDTSLSKDESFSEDSTMFDIDKEEIYIFKKSYVINNKKEKIYFDPARLSNLNSFNNVAEAENTYTKESTTVSANPTYSNKTSNLAQNLISKILPKYIFSLYKSQLQTNGANSNYFRNFKNNDTSGYFFNTAITKVDLRNFSKSMYSHVKIPNIKTENTQYSLTLDGQCLPSDYGDYIQPPDNVDNNKNIVTIYFPLGFKPTDTKIITQKDIQSIPDHKKNPFQDLLFHSDLDGNKYYLKCAIYDSTFFSYVMSTMNISFNKSEASFNCNIETPDIDKLSFENIFSIVTLQIKDNKLIEEKAESIIYKYYNLSDFSMQWGNDSNTPVTSEYAVSANYKIEKKKLMICFNDYVAENPTALLKGSSFSLSKSNFSHVIQDVENEIPESLFYYGDGNDNEKNKDIKDFDKTVSSDDSLSYLNDINGDRSGLPAHYLHILSNPIVFSKFLKFPIYSRIYPTSLYDADIQNDITIDTSNKDSKKKFKLFLDIQDKIINESTQPNSFEKIPTISAPNTTSYFLLNDTITDGTYNHRYAIKQYIEIDLKELYKEIVTSMINIEAFNFDESV